jgi:mRNA interferase MazF
VNRGEVWWVELPEQKRRPYLVITRNAVIPLLNRVLAVPATSTIRNIPTEVLLGIDDGLTKECALSFDNIETIPKWAFVDLITQLPAHKLDQVCRALALATECE